MIICIQTVKRKKISLISSYLWTIIAQQHDQDNFSIKIVGTWLIKLFVVSQPKELVRRLTFRMHATVDY
jgi:hypothetical protein